MQMLQQVFGPDGARYVAWLVTALAIIILALFVWWLIRKALGDRINMSDRADRRGRPPRLGVTESFSIGPQGRRLVMVRRDNVEHLIMIGGPNDVVIETNVMRGERPVVGRGEPRVAEPEAIILPDPTPVVRGTTPEPRPEPKPEPKLEPLIPVMPAAPPALQPQPLPAARQSEPPKPVAPPAVAPVLPVEPSPVAEPKPPQSSLTERLKAGLGRVAPAAEPAAVPPAPTGPAPLSADDMPKPTMADRLKAGIGRVAPTEAPKVEPPPVPTAAEMKTKIEEAVFAKVMPPPGKAMPAVPPPPPAPVAPPPPPAPVAAPPPPPVPVAAPPPPPVPVAPPPPAPPPPVPAPPSAAVAAPVAPPPAQAAAPPRTGTSKNPFDSLEEEMAKLLGRAPDGKG